MLTTRVLKNRVGKVSPKSTVEESRAGTGWHIFVGGAAGRLRALVKPDPEVGTISFVIGMQRSRAYDPKEVETMVGDLMAAFDRARDVARIRAGTR